MEGVETVDCGPVRPLAAILVEPLIRGKVKDCDAWSKHSHVVRTVHDQLLHSSLNWDFWFVLRHFIVDFRCCKPSDARCCHMGTAIKHPRSEVMWCRICAMPLTSENITAAITAAYVNPLMPTVAIWAHFWHPGILTSSRERQSVWMSKITSDGLTRSGTGCTHMPIVGLLLVWHAPLGVAKGQYYESVSVLAVCWLFILSAQTAS